MWLMDGPTMRKRSQHPVGQMFMNRMQQGAGGADAMDGALRNYIVQRAQNGGGGATNPEQPTGPVSDPVSQQPAESQQPQAPGSSFANADPNALSIWDALNTVDEKRHPGEDTWVDQYKQMLVEQLIPAAIGQGGWGYNRVMNSLTGDWPDYAMQVAKYSLGIGPPVYNRSGDGSTAGLVYVPGFAGSAPRSRTGLREGEYGRYDPQGRYLGFKSGLFGDAYVY